MSEELCPCPFCGGQPRTVTESIDPDDLEFMSIDEIDDPDYLGVTCGNDECVANGWWLSPEEWNTRPIEDALHARIAELEAAQRWHVVKECNDVATPIDVALRKRIAELEAERRWIPVSERLPELGSPILFYDSILERINKGT